jgi:hypothetical protein
MSEFGNKAESICSREHFAFWPPIVISAVAQQLHCWRK